MGLFFIFGNGFISRSRFHSFFRKNRTLIFLIDFLNTRNTIFAYFLLLFHGIFIAMSSPLLMCENTFALKKWNLFTGCLLLSLSIKKNRFKLNLNITVQLKTRVLVFVVLTSNLGGV